MIKLGCGCKEISQTPIEFKIDTCSQINTNYGLTLPNINNSNELDSLKNKVICDFQKIIKQLRCGIQPDIEIILEEISLIFIMNYNVVKLVSEQNISENNYLLNKDDLWDDFPTEGHVDKGVNSDSLYNLFLQYVLKSEIPDIYQNLLTFRIFSGDYSNLQLKNIISSNQYLKNLTTNEKSFNIELNQDNYLYIIVEDSDTDKFIRADLNGLEIPFETNNIDYNNKTYTIYKSINRYNEGIYNIDING